MEPASFVAPFWALVIPIAKTQRAKTHSSRLKIATALTSCRDIPDYSQNQLVRMRSTRGLDHPMPEKADAIVLENLKVLFKSPVDWHADFPRTTEGLRIVDRS